MTDTTEVPMQFTAVDDEQYVRVSDVLGYLNVLAGKLEGEVPGGSVSLRQAMIAIADASASAHRNPVQR